MSAGMAATRRKFLHTLAAGAGALTLPKGAFNQTRLTKTPLAGKLSLTTGAGNNIVILEDSAAGSLLVDCGDAAHAPDVLAVAGNVRTVFNTHWHLEATGANEAMTQAGATLISQISTQLWMTQEIIHTWEDKVFPPRPQQAQPTQTFYTGGKMTFAGQTVAYDLMPMAHTDGDIYVHFPESNVLVVGDVVQVGRLPVLDFATGGWLGGMQNAHRTILELANDDTLIVTGTGPVLHRSDVELNLEVITEIRDTLVELMKQGKGVQNMIDENALEAFTGRLEGDPDEFLFMAYRGLWAHVRELGGIV